MLRLVVPAAVLLLMVSVDGERVGLALVGAMPGAPLLTRNIPPSVLLGLVARQQLLPLAAGMALMAFAPAFSRRAQRLLNVAGNALLVAGFAIVLVALGPALAQMSPWTPVAAALLAAVSMATVRLLLRVDDVTEQTLAICNANRHVGLALLVGGQYLNAQRAVPAIASYALLAPLLMALYARGLKSVAPSAAGA